jgi:hypothetical protein
MKLKTAAAECTKTLAVYSDVRSFNLDLDKCYLYAKTNTGFSHKFVENLPDFEFIANREIEAFHVYKSGTMKVLLRNW